MTTKYFKAFVQEVQNAADNDPIWFMGYLWIDLTKCQAKKIITVLESRNFPKKVNAIGEYIELPSGMGVYTNQN